MVLTAISLTWPACPCELPWVNRALTRRSQMRRTNMNLEASGKHETTGQWPPYRRGRASLLLGFTLLSAGLLQAQTRRLDTTSFVVMGEGLAAGMADFGLAATVQQYSFPSQVALQMQTGF